MGAAETAAAQAGLQLCTTQGLPGRGGSLHLPRHVSKPVRATPGEVGWHSVITQTQKAPFPWGSVTAPLPQLPQGKPERQVKKSEDA